MNQLYALVGMSKQSHWEWQQRQLLLEDKWLLLEPVLREWRSRHPSMSLKKLYKKIAPNFVGRDTFIDYAKENGFKAIRYAKQPVSTISERKENFPNLLIDLPIVDINQVWVSDTTYFKIHQRWYYITFIMDLYSRYIIGYKAAQSLFAKANLQALQMALEFRNISKYIYQLIHHSDRGLQFKSKIYTQLLEQVQIKSSMGRIVYDNIHAERLNQTIKGEYLFHRNIQSFKDLEKHLQKDVWLYNHERPHGALGMKSPAEFERYICNIPLCQRTILKVFTSKQSKIYQKQRLSKNQLIEPSAQLKLPF